MNSAWLAMSARYSKTSSRGRAIVTRRSTGSTARGVLPAAPRQAARRRTVVPALGVAHELASAPARSRRSGRHSSQTSAPSLVAVDALADQRRAAAVRAARRPAASAPDALAQQLALEIASEMPSSGRIMP